jgi:dephospho-CoA kinase
MLGAALMILAVTGCSGTGASTVAAVWGNLGASVCSLDKVGHGFLGKPAVKQALQQRLGIKGLAEMSTEAIRNRLRESAFNDPSILSGINEVIHCRLKLWVAYSAIRLREYKGVFVLDAALIFELGLEHIPDYVITVTDHLDRAVERLVKRDRITRETAIGRWKSQIGLKEKSYRSHFVIENRDTEELLIKRAADFYNGVIKRMEDANWHTELEKS